MTHSDATRSLARTLGVDRIEPRLISELGLVAKRPRYSALATERGRQLPTLEGALTSRGGVRTAA